MSTSARHVTLVRRIDSVGVRYRSLTGGTGEVNIFYSCTPHFYCTGSYPILFITQYTTGWTGSGGSKSDKKVGVVGLTCFDLRRRGKVGDLQMVGTTGSKVGITSRCLFFGGDCAKEGISIRMGI